MFNRTAKFKRFAHIEEEKEIREESQNNIADFMKEIATLNEEIRRHLASSEENEKQSEMLKKLFDNECIDENGDPLNH